MELEEADQALHLLSNGIRRLKMKVGEAQDKLDEIVRADENVGFCAALLDVIDERNTALARVAELEGELLECKKLAISTLSDGEQGHEGPGGTLERVIALAKRAAGLDS